MQPDPLGNVLGAMFENVLKAHPDFGLANGTDEDLLLSDFSAGPSAGVAVLYRFKTKVLQSITWTDVIARRGPALPPIAEARGVTPDTAIVDGEKSDRAAVGWEYDYLRLHPCAANDAWKVAKQSTLTDPKPIDRLHVTCAATGEERDFYFDISRSYGNFYEARTAGPRVMSGALPLCSSTQWHAATWPGA